MDFLLKLDNRFSDSKVEEVVVEADRLVFHGVLVPDHYIQTREHIDNFSEIARKADRSRKADNATSLRGDQNSPEKHAEKIEPSIELDAKSLVTYFPRDERHPDYMRIFAGELTPPFHSHLSITEVM